MDDAVVAGGAPISTALPSLDGMFDLHGWQIMYIAEGIPTIVAGFATLFIMTDKPEPAKFLTALQKGAAGGKVQVLAESLAAALGKPASAALKALETDSYLQHILKAMLTVRAPTS